MTKTSVIFGVVSVLIAAIVGGSFFIKNYLDSNFFRSKNIFNKKETDLKDAIKKFQANLNKYINNKQKLQQTIKNQKKNLEILEQLVSKKNQKITELENIPENIKVEKSAKIIGSDAKYEKAPKKYQEVQEQIKKLLKKINSNSKKPIFPLLLTLASANKRFAALDRTMKQLAVRHYIVDKRKKPTWLKINKGAREKINQQIKKIQENLNNNSNLLSKIETLIQLLTSKISDKKLELSSLKIN